MLAGHDLTSIIKVSWSHLFDLSLAVVTVQYNVHCTVLCIVNGHTVRLEDQLTRHVTF